MRADLASVHAEFVAAFADIPRSRIVPEGGAKLSAAETKKREDRFLDKSFNGCPTLTLDATKTFNALQTSIKPSAARCFKVRVDPIPAAPSNQAVVSMTVSPAPSRELSPIRIGKSSGMDLAPVMPFVPAERRSAPGYGMASVGASTTRVRRGSSSADRCEDIRLRYNLCGPKLEIQLKLVPKSVTATTTNMTGGVFNQFPSSESGMVIGQSMQDGGESLRALAAMDPEVIEGDWFRSGSR